MSAVRGSVASRDHPACSLGRLLVQVHSFIAQSIAHRLRRSPLCATALKLFPISGPITARLSNGESAACHVVTPTPSMRIAIPSPRRGWIGTRRVGLAAPNSYLYRPSPIQRRPMRSGRLQSPSGPHRRPEAPLLWECPKSWTRSQASRSAQGVRPSEPGRTGCPANLHGL